MYFDGILESVVPSISTVIFDLLANPTSTGSDPILYIGGRPENLTDVGMASSLPSFTGCMEDLALNYRYFISH